MFGRNKSRKEAKKKPNVSAKQEFHYYDYPLVACIVLLTCFGLVMLYSTSSYSAQVTFGDDMFYLKKQAFYGGLSFVLMVLLSLKDYHFYAKWSPLLYIVSDILLVITKFFGTEIYGAKRWLYIAGIFSFQPAELAKLSVILFLAVLMEKMESKTYAWRGFFTILGIGGFTSLLTLVFTDNLSTAIIIAGITVGMLFVVFPKKWPFAAGGGVMAILVFVVTRYASTLNGSENFRLRRVIVWLNPEQNQSLGGYQIMQGLYAIGSGGLFGKGLGNSLQKVGYVPEAQNDMILTIIGEELGILGVAVLTLLFVYMLYRLLVIAQNAPDLMGSMIACGVFVHIALQVIFNIAVVTNAIPTTGITLPFVSYGGSAIAFLMGEMMLALSVSRQIKFKNSDA